MNLEIFQADYHNEKHARDLMHLLSVYALDPMGGGEDLSDYAKENLIKQLRKSNSVFSVLSYIDGKPVGLINAIVGFSTFAAKPLVNLHDIVVLDGYRGKKISQKMILKAEEIAKTKGCCKLTLEVLEGNKLAQLAYEKAGFSGYELDPEMGKAVFWQKKIEG